MPTITIELMNGRIEKVHGVPPEYDVVVHDFDHVGYAEPYAIKRYDTVREAIHTIERPETATEPFTH